MVRGGDGVAIHSEVARPFLPSAPCIGIRTSLLSALFLPNWRWGWGGSSYTSLFGGFWGIGVPGTTMQHQSWPCLRWPLRTSSSWSPASGASPQTFPDARVLLREALQHHFSHHPAGSKTLLQKTPSFLNRPLTQIQPWAFSPAQRPACRITALEIQQDLMWVYFIQNPGAENITWSWR